MPVWVGDGVVMPDTVEVVDPWIVEDPTVVVRWW
jgi:hypothetical protein